MKKLAFALVFGTLIGVATTVSIIPDAEANACARNPAVCQ